MACCNASVSGTLAACLSLSRILPYPSKGFSAAAAAELKKLDGTPAGVGFNKFKPNLANSKYFCLVYSSWSGPTDALNIGNKSS
jgi:hypothetical protein